MSSANRFLLTFLGRPQAHVLHAQACAAQEDDSPDSSSRRLTNARCKAAGGGLCSVHTCGVFGGVPLGVEHVRPLQVVLHALEAFSCRITPP